MFLEWLENFNANIFFCYEFLMEESQATSRAFLKS